MLSCQIIPLNQYLTQIIDPTGVSCFLLQGSQESVLIDTGTGMRQLLQALEDLSVSSPLVLLSHGHADHAGGAAWFDQVYLNRLDWQLVQKHCSLDMRMGYARFAIPPEEQTFASDDFAPLKPDGYKSLESGQIFNLGGLSIEAIHVPGHTQGSMCFLVPELRIMLYGDACNSNTFLFDKNASTVSGYYETLLDFKKYDEFYDTVLFSHGPVTGSKQVLEDNIELCEKIIKRTDDAMPFAFMDKQALRAAAVDENLNRLDGRIGNIIYSENRI